MAKSFQEEVKKVDWKAAADSTQELKLPAWLSTLWPMLLEWLAKLFPAPVGPEEDHVEYPSAFPTQCVKDALEIFGGGQARIVTQARDLGLHLVQVQLWLMGRMLPEGATTYGDDPDAFKLLDELEKKLDEAIKTPSTPAKAANEFGAIDIATLLKIFELVRMLIALLKGKPIPA